MNTINAHVRFKGLSEMLKGYQQSINKHQGACYAQG